MRVISIVGNDKENHAVYTGNMHTKLLVAKISEEDFLIRLREKRKTYEKEY